MRMKPFKNRLGPLILVFVLIPNLGLARQDGSAEERLADYIQQARASAAATPRTAGSLWSSDGRFADLAADYKARNVNDLIVIHVIEQTRARAAGSIQSQRDFEANSGLAGLFGILGARSGLQTLLSPNSSQTLAGQAQSDSDTLLSTTLAGHVVEVLPNGYMVVRAAREVDMNNERQTLVVHGVVRPGDVAPDNSVLSTSLSHLEVHLSGKGVISDGVRRPGGIMRRILGVLGF